MKVNRLIYLLIIMIIGTYVFIPTNSIHSASSSHTDYLKARIDKIQSNWSWGLIDIVSTESDDTSDDSDIAVDVNGNVHVVWTDYANYSGAGDDLDILYRCWNSTIQNWTITEVVSTEGVEWSFAPCIDVDNSGNVHVAWYSDIIGYDGPDLDIIYKRRYNNNNSWTQAEVVSINTDSISSDPMITTDIFGNVHIVWEDWTDNYQGSGNDFDIFYRRWHQITNTWTSVELISEGSSESSRFPCITSSDSGNIHVGWRDGTDNYYSSGVDEDIFYRMWDSTISSWGVIELVSHGSTEYSDYVDIAVDPTGNIHMCWMDETNINGAGSDADIFYTQRSNEMNNWANIQIVSTESNTSDSAYPKIEADFSGNVHIVWHDNIDYLGYGTDFDVFYKRGINLNKWNQSGIAWAPSEVISYESDNDSIYPRICVDRANSIHISWDDKENRTILNSDTDVFYRKFSGNLDQPILNSISPNPSTNGNITLKWNDIYGASSYSIYRDENSTISSINGKSPIATISDTSFREHVNSSGTYYYVIVANNFVTTSSLSNCESVVVKLEPIDLEQLLIIGGGGFIVGCITLIVLQLIRRK